jgi:hypothetical protein
VVKYSDIPPKPKIWPLSEHKILYNHVEMKANLLQLASLLLKMLIAAYTFTFQIDNKKKNIFRDAVDGYDVTECSSLACLSNPCFGSATCVEDKDKWHCLCPSGYHRINTVL